MAIGTIEKEEKMGLDETHEDYLKCKWCYDTPGVIQPDQILHLLTSQELEYTLPKSIIKPRTFMLKPGQSLLIAGLARLDCLNTKEKFIR